MKVIHITSKILLFVVEIAVVLIVLASVIPIVAGGLSIDVTDEPEAVHEGDRVKIDGAMSVTSSLLWDITDFTYYVSVGNEDMTIACSAPVMMTIPKGETTHISFHIEVPVISLALLMVDSGIDEEGNIGNMRIPLQFGIGGAYIQNLVKFDLNVDMSVETVGTSGHVNYDENTNTLDIEVKYTPGTDLRIPETSGTIVVGDNDATGSFSIIESNGEYTITFELGTNSSTDLLEALEGNDITVNIEGESYPLSSSDTEVMISLLRDIINKSEVVP